MDLLTHSVSSADNRQIITWMETWFQAFVNELLVPTKFTVRVF